MSASTDTSTYEPEFHMLYDLLASPGYMKEEMRIEREGEKKAIQWRLRFYGFIRAKGMEAMRARRIKTEESQNLATQLEAALTRVKGYRLVLRENAVLIQDRATGDPALFNMLFAEMEEAAKLAKAAKQVHTEVEHTIAHQPDFYDKTYGAGIEAAHTPQPAFEDPYSEPTPANAMAEPPTGIKSNTLCFNTLTRLNQADPLLPKPITLPFSSVAEAEGFLTLWQDFCSGSPDVPQHSAGVDGRNVELRRMA